jgi:hypothetical protein
VGKQARGLRLGLKKKTEKLIKSRKLKKINQKNRIMKKN